MAADAYFSSVSALLHFDGTNASTVVIDNSHNAYTFTAVGAAKLTTVVSRFGGACLDLTGGGYVQCPVSSDFAFGTGDFTIEFWAWKSANGGGGYDTAVTTDTTNGNATNSWALELSSSRGLLLAADGQPLIAYSTNPNDSAWHHWAISREGSTLRAFRDGVLVATATSSLSILATGPLGVGGNQNLTSYPFNGYIDELRITKGVARYTANFTPPTEAFGGAPVFALSGTVRDATGVLAARRVVAKLENGADLGSTFSDPVTGAYSIPVTSDSPHTLVFYPADGENLNALVLRGVLPIAT